MRLACGGAAVVLEPLRDECRNAQAGDRRRSGLAITALARTSKSEATKGACPAVCTYVMLLTPPTRIVGFEYTPLRFPIRIALIGREPQPVFWSLKMRLFATALALLARLRAIASHNRRSRTDGVEAGARDCSNAHGGVVTAWRKNYVITWLRLAFAGHRHMRTPPRQSLLHSPPHSSESHNLPRINRNLIHSC